MASITELIVPRTQVRLSPYIKLLAPRGGYDGLAGPPTDFSTNFQEVGAIQSLEIANSREAYLWRELNMDTMGLIRETYPGLPTYDLTIKRLVLYRANALEEFGFFGEDIINQTAPLVIKLELFAPSSTLSVAASGTVGDPTRADMRTPIYQAVNQGQVPSRSPLNTVGDRRAWVLTGVWFKENPMTFDINGDLKIEQTIPAIAANIQAV